MNLMHSAPPSSDAELLELLRTTGPMSVAGLAQIMNVTPTAVRQRLSRLLAQGMLRRDAVRAGRGRPKHSYQLTEKGLRVTGSNFRDLASALWREVEQIANPEIRRRILERLAKTLARQYATQVEGRSVEERMRSLSALLDERRVPFSVGRAGGLPMLTAHACPYPDLADRDRNVCVMETMLFAEVLGGDMRLTEYRLDGGSSCRFQPSDASAILGGVTPTAGNLAGGDNAAYDGGPPRPSPAHL